MLITLDTTLLEKVRKRDQSAMFQLFTETRDYVFFLAQCYTSKESELHSLLKETYLYLLGRMDDYPTETAFPLWIGQVMAMKFMLSANAKKLKLNTKEAMTGLPNEDELFPKAWIEDEHKQKNILRILRSLPDPQRLTVLMAYTTGLSVSELAKCLHIKESAALVHLTHGRDALRDTSTDEDNKGNEYPVLTQLLWSLGTVNSMPVDLAKEIYQQIMMFFMTGGTVAKVSMGTTNKKPEKAGSRIDTLIAIVIIIGVIGAIVGYYFHYQKRQSEISAQLISEYNQQKQQEQLAINDAPSEPNQEIVSNDERTLGAQEEATTNPFEANNSNPTMEIPPAG